MKKITIIAMLMALLFSSCQMSVDDTSDDTVSTVATSPVYGICINTFQTQSANYGDYYGRCQGVSIEIDEAGYTELVETLTFDMTDSTSNAEAFRLDESETEGLQIGQDSDGAYKLVFDSHGVVVSIKSVTYDIYDTTTGTSQILEGSGELIYTYGLPGITAIWLIKGY